MENLRKTIFVYLYRFFAEFNTSIVFAPFRTPWLNGSTGPQNQKSKIRFFFDFAIKLVTWLNPFLDAFDNFSQNPILWLLSIFRILLLIHPIKTKTKIEFSFYINFPKKLWRHKGVKTDLVTSEIPFLYHYTLFAKSK